MLFSGRAGLPPLGLTKRDTASLCVTPLPADRGSKVPTPEGIPQFSAIPAHDRQKHAARTADDGDVPERSGRVEPCASPSMPGVPKPMRNTVGEAIRAFRLRQRLTLFDVARLSGNEFKVSSLGAYERGDRSITYERLQRLAAVYGVDVQSLLPSEPEREIDLVAYERRGGIVIDLSRFRTRFDARAGAVMDFGNAIKTLRRGSDSSVIVVRRSDAAFLATAMNCDPEAIDDVLMGQAKAEPRNREAVHQRSPSVTAPGLTDPHSPLEEGGESAGGLAENRRDGGGVPRADVGGGDADAPLLHDGAGRNGRPHMEQT